ncbi:hypothetical protein FI667_g3850, partial [Globisporangium splendens]
MLADVPATAECASDAAATSTSDAFTRNTVRLVPIIPPHENLPGAMDVDMEWNRLVYLEPLTSVKKEIYRGKHASASQNKERSKEDDYPESQLTSPADKSLLSGSSTSTSAPFASSSQYSQSQNDNNKPNGSADRDEDDQIARLKQKVRLLPITDSDREEFWDAIKRHKKLQAQIHKSLVHNQSTPMGFNMEAAWSKTDTDANAEGNPGVASSRGEERNADCNAVRIPTENVCRIIASLGNPKASHSASWGLKKLQQMWRVKSAKRRLNFLILQRAWVEKETLLVGAAAEGYERRLVKNDQSQARKNKKPAAKKRNSANDPEKWLTFVEESIRAQVIKEHILEAEKDSVTRFRQQELVQTLRGEQPNKPRSYVKVIASNCALLGRVHSVLQLFPGAVDDVPRIEPFDAELLNAGGEEYKKQLALLLEKRQQFRHFIPAHPADEPVVRLTDDKSTHQPVKQEAKLDRGESKAGDQAESSAVASKPENELSGHLKAKTIPKNSYGLVVVSCSFRHLPCLPEKTKEIAAALFDSLVDTNFNRFSRRGSRLLLNPSVIEFQDTLKELQSICEKDSSFFLCLSSHGARVVKGVSEGSYVLFSETRLSSEDELLLTSVHETELAKLIHGLNTILIEACNPKSEISLSCAEDGVSNFLHRLNDAFRGGAVVENLNSDADRRPLFAFEVIKYASEMVHKDAEKANTVVKDEYTKQARTKYELTAEFQEITQTAQLLGAESAENYGLGSIPGESEQDLCPNCV